MDHVSVVSSTLASVGYAPRTRTLEVRFTSGSVYRYFGVSRRVYAELLAASSKGAYFNRHIRDRFPYARL